jgi:hypothetical protein
MFALAHESLPGNHTSPGFYEQAYKLFDVVKTESKAMLKLSHACALFREDIWKTGGKLWVSSQLHATTILSQRKDMPYPLDEKLRAHSLSGHGEGKNYCPRWKLNPDAQLEGNHSTVPTKKKKQLARLW